MDKEYEEALAQCKEWIEKAKTEFKKYVSGLNDTELEFTRNTLIIFGEDHPYVRTLEEEIKTRPGYARKEQEPSDQRYFPISLTSSMLAYMRHLVGNSNEEPLELNQQFKEKRQFRGKQKFREKQR